MGTEAPREVGSHLRRALAHRTVEVQPVANLAARTWENPVPTNHRTTERDRQALAYVATMRAVRRDDLAQLLATLGHGVKAEPLGDRTTRDIVARWVALGLARTEPYAGRGPAVVLTTGRGAALNRLPRPKPPSWTETPHTLSTAAVAVRYLAEAGGVWESETYLRARIEKGEHLPDGLWHPPVPDGAPVPAPVAIEVERSIKAGDRWARIASDLLSRYPSVHYWLSPPTRAAWLRWAAEHLIEADRDRVVLYDLEQHGLSR